MTVTPPARSAETFTISRIFDAPRALVWAALTEPQHLAQWWAAPGTKPGVSRMDLRPGGSLHYSMVTDGGEAMWGKWQILDVDAPSRLTALTSFSDEQGGITRHPMAPVWPLLTYAEMDLAEAGGKTTLTVSWTPYEASDAERALFAASHASMSGGWGYSLDLLGKHLSRQLAGDLPPPASESEVFVLSRTLDAPISLAWEMWTKPEHLGQWFGMPGAPFKVAAFDLKPGGTFLYGMQMPGGLMSWGKWVFREIAAPDRLAYVVSFCNEAGEPVRHPMAPLWPLEVLAVQTLTAQGDKTLFESRSYPINATAEERAVFTAGHASMEMGFSGTLMALEAYLAKLKQG